MRIAFLLGTFPSLSETFVLNQITGLIDRGHEIDIYAEQPGGPSEAHPDVLAYGLLPRTRFEALPTSRVRRLLELPWRLARDPLPARCLARALDGRRHGLDAVSLRLAYSCLPFAPGRRYDVVHAHFGANGRRAALLRETGILAGPVVTSFHGADITLYPRRRGAGVYEPLFRSGELFLPVSARWNERLVALGCPAGRIVVHRMGVDCRRFVPGALRARRSRVRLVTVARLVEKKGVEDALRALAKLRGSGVETELRVAGDGPLRRSLEAMARELGLGDVVRWLGTVRHGELPALLAGSDVFLGPSRMADDGDEEGIPVAIMEAMASGLPVVATTHSAIPELVENGRSGWLVPERDPDALAARLAQLAGDPDARAAMGRAGRARVLEEFDAARLTDRLLNLYAQVA
jgi:colanic acid/amylovoran biosynthesis glycosyltransferase